MEKIREIVFYKNYFLDFFESLPSKVRNKIDEVLFMFTIIERVPVKFFQKITATKGLYEIRVEFESNIYRIFCCLDQGNMIILFNGFQKKTQKTPKKELEKAERIMEEYLELKIMERDKDLKTFSDHLDERYGKIGTKERTEFEIKAKSFAIGELIREERKNANLTQEQLT